MVTDFAMFFSLLEFKLLTNKLFVVFFCHNYGTATNATRKFLGNIFTTNETLK